ncbi:MAG: hypothetical protein ACR2HS_05695, partial [Gammaproteobacteria bacterium]
YNIMNNKVHPVTEKSTNRIFVKPTTLNEIDLNRIVAVPPNQEPQEEKPKALFVHHSNSTTEKIGMHQLFKAGFDVEIINIHEQLNEINKDETLSPEEKREKIWKILQDVEEEVGKLLENNTYKFSLVEANLGFPGSEESTCGKILEIIRAKQKKANQGTENQNMIATMSNTLGCVIETFKAHKGLYYIGNLTFNKPEDKEIVDGRIFKKVSELLEFHKSLQVPGSPTASSTSNNSGPVLSIASSPKSQPENSTPVGCSNKQNFSSRLASCFTWNSDRNKSDGNKNKSSTPTMEDSFTYVAAKNHKVNNRK